jgi:hypothetical protein
MGGEQGGVGAAERPDDASGELVLNREEISPLAIVTLGPQVVALRRIDQLSIDAKAVADPLDAAFQNVADPKLVPTSPLRSNSFGSSWARTGSPIVTILRMGWGGRPVRQEQAQGILVAALGILASRDGYSEAKQAS